MSIQTGPRFPKKTIRLHCGRFLLRTLRDDDATERFAGWLSDPTSAEILNAPVRSFNKSDVLNYIKGFDQRTHLLGGVFEKSTNSHVGMLRLDIDYRSKRALVNLLIGERRYRNTGVTSEIFIPALDMGFNELEIETMTASVLLRHKMLIKYLLKTGWQMNPVPGQSIRSHADGAMLEVRLFSLTRNDWVRWKQTARAKRIMQILESRKKS